MISLLRKPIFLSGCLAAGFLALNLATADRSPVVWTDEVMFADPAVNAALGHGFTTTAWLQPRHAFFAGNAPLHSLVLVPWLDVFGVSPSAVRSLNYGLVLAAVCITVWAAKRLDLIRSNGAEVLLAGLILCGDGVSFSYRSGRYDCLGMLWIALMFASQTLKGPRIRALAIGLLAALVPATGLQLIPYVAMLGVLLLVLKGRPAIGDLAAAALGGLAGLALLAGFFRANGVLGEFQNSLSYFGGAHRSLARRGVDALRAPLIEPSSILLLMALLAILAGEFAQRKLKARSPVVVGLLVGIIIPCALGFTGKYVRYYAWMAYAPMALTLVASLDHSVKRGNLTRIVFGLTLLAGAVGFPARMALTLLEWDLRDPGPVGRLVAETVRPGDWIYTEFEAYYPAKVAAEETFLPPYLGIISVPGRDRVPAVMTPAERDRVNVLITKPDREAMTLEEFPGDWNRVGHYAAGSTRGAGLFGRLRFGSKPYELTVYRRAESAIGDSK